VTALIRATLAVLLILILAGILAVASIFAPYRGFSGQTFVDFPKGTSTRAMASQLARAGVIRYRWQFLLARALRPAARLQAGEYEFTRAGSVPHVFDRIVRGDVFYYEITVPEGSNMFDIAGLASDLGFIHRNDFLKAAENPALIRDLDPKAGTLEGYLFPSTYRLTRSTTAAQLCRMMVDQFRRRWKALTAHIRPPPNVHDTVTLASMVEKETAQPAERPEIASVYRNRLDHGMMLDCDPTTIYAALLENRYRGTIYASDLASRNAYNTYQHAGLPPGPIANPGVASLKAALAPADTNYLYFVAKPDGSGSHQFSSNYAAHQKAVEAYRRAEKR
jgi:peptidoglycan lytic transglycosylase G